MRFFVYLLLLSLSTTANAEGRRYAIVQPTIPKSEALQRLDAAILKLRPAVESAESNRWTILCKQSDITPQERNVCKFGLPSIYLRQQARLTYCQNMREKVRASPAEWDGMMDFDVRTDVPLCEHWAGTSNSP